MKATYNGTCITFNGKWITNCHNIKYDISLKTKKTLSTDPCKNKASIDMNFIMNLHFLVQKT